MSNPTTSLDTALSTVLAAAQGLADEAFALTSSIQASAAAGLATARAIEGLTAIEDLVHIALSAPDTHVQGAGFVAAVGLLEPERWWLEWFVREDDGKVSRLEVQRDPTAMGFYDYDNSPWYAVPRASGARHITGPYVDNLCTDDYTLTFTQPLIVNGEFLGVSGADIGVRAAERVLLPCLRAVGSPAAIVNADQRVLVSNTGAMMCGDLLEADATVTTRLELPGLPLAVLALD